MKNKKFLTESDKKAIIANKEKAIIESFAKTFNKIKRVDEDFQINNDDNYNPKIMGDLEYKILEGYLEAAIWTEEEELGSASINDLSDEARESANNDVITFMKNAGNLLEGIDGEQIGHDLWLTRNGHGAGFWDRGLGEQGEKLTKIAKSMGEKYLYRGDDNKLYFN
jgi:hypothetical protein